MRRAIPLLAAAALVAGCGSSSKSSNTPASTPASTPTAASGAPAAKSVSVNIKNFLFAAPSVAVKVGGTVTWTNQDSAEHTATADNGSAFDSGTLMQGKSSMAITFKTAGTFTYHCAFHAFMHGTVAVTA